ncbi:MAG: hypothetical protein ACOCWJ_05010, partial [Verrucomicrobiota bacterium]
TPTPAVKRELKIMCPATQPINLVHPAAFAIVVCKKIVTVHGLVFTVHSYKRSHGRNMKTDVTTKITKEHEGWHLTSCQTVLLAVRLRFIMHAAPFTGRKKSGGTLRVVSGLRSSLPRAALLGLKPGADGGGCLLAPIFASGLHSRYNGLSYASRTGKRNFLVRVPYSFKCCFSKVRMELAVANSH